MNLLRLFITAGLAITLALSSFTPALAQDGARASIEAVYARRYKSASARYLYGMNAGYADDFITVDPNGEEVDMEDFQQSWKNIMARCLRTEWSGKILEFERLSDKKVRCKVSDTFNALRTDQRFLRLTSAGTVTLSEDTWELKNGTWEQTRCQILRHRQFLTGLEEKDPVAPPLNGQKQRTKQQEASEAPQR